MRNLFLKIFLLCWLINTAVFGALIAYRSWSDRGNGLTDHARSAIEVLRERGPEAMQQHLGNVRWRFGMHIFLFDEQAREVSDRPAPQHIREVAQQTLRGDAPPPSDGRRRLFGERVMTDDGARYIVVAQARRGPPRGRWPWRRFFGRRLLEIAIAAALVAYLLARYVTRPVRKLQTATQQFADGDLSARVERTVARRRDVIGDLGKGFDQMAQRIGSLVDAQQRLLRDVSHELRSPLARLNVALGLAGRQAGPQAQGALDRIEREAERLNDLIARLLTISRLETTAPAAQFSELDLTTLLQDVAEDANFEARSQQRRVQVNTDESCNVMGTEALLRSAFENVIRNAVQYTPENTAVDVDIAAQTIDDRPWAVVTVRDRGPGVPDADLQSIFKPFYRTSDARDRGSGGTGLGLAITVRAIQAHHGFVEASNAPDGGLIVKIRLPLLPAD